MKKLLQKRSRIVKIFLSLFVVGCTLIAIASSLGVKKESTALMSGDSSDVIQTLAEVTEHVKSIHGNKKDFKILDNKTVLKIIDNENYSQSALNATYNKNNNSNVSGTCTEVAAANITLVYLTRADEENQKDINEIFEETLNMAISNGYYKNGVGTNNINCDDVLNDSLKAFSTGKKSTRSVWSVYNTLKENIDNNNLTMFNISGHSMVGVGYYEIPYTYSKQHTFLWKKWTTTERETVKYVVVNDGWQATNGVKFKNDDEYFDAKYSFFPEEKIGKSFFAQLFRYSSYDNCEVKNK